MDTLLSPIKGAERRELGGVQVDVVRAGEARVKRIVYPPGFRWSTHMQPITKTDRCMHAHVGFLVRGQIHVEYADGCVHEFAAPAAVAIDPGHDGWVVGERGGYPDRDRFRVRHDRAAGDARDAFAQLAQLEGTMNSRRGISRAAVGSLLCVVSAAVTMSAGGVTQKTSTSPLSRLVPIHVTLKLPVEPCTVPNVTAAHCEAGRCARGRRVSARGVREESPSRSRGSAADRKVL